MSNEQINGIVCYILHSLNGEILVTTDSDYAESLSKDGTGTYIMYTGTYYNPI
jgi:hypothetical protein